MPRKSPVVSPLKLRKELLIAESELNRAQLIDEWAAATEWHRALNAGVKTAGSIASVTVLLVTALRAFRRKHDAKDSAKSSWVQPLIRGATMISSLWETFRSRGVAQKEK
jgi:hypothetical protein